MDTSFRLMPPGASNHADGVDNLYLFLWAVSAFFTVLIAALIIYFAIKYRRRREDEVGRKVHTNYLLEVVWTVVPLIIVTIMFVWAARVLYAQSRPPPDAMDIYVIGKQWMWKIQHENGKRELNELHVPLGRAVRLTMASQDVIHSFFIPAFRIKQDVIPGRYVTEWFRATKIGTYHLFCAEYCGNQHSGMIGSVTVMEPSDYEAWLAGTANDLPPAQAGEKLFLNLGCATCHGQRAPTMAGLYGSRRALSDGSTVVADDAYLRESILDSTAKIVQGYQPLMPSYRGQISEEQLMQVVAYIRSLAQPALPPSKEVRPAHE
jgi:cytochrome c oxidase subunit 2